MGGDGDAWLTEAGGQRERGRRWREHIWEQVAKLEHGVKSRGGGRGGVGRSMSREKMNKNEHYLQIW